MSLSLHRTRKDALLSIFCCMLVAPASFAANESPKYEMSVIRDAAYGSKVLVGQHAEAIRKINERNYRKQQQFFAHTNLCVAYTLTGDFDAAKRECESALSEVAETPSAAREEVKDAQRRYQAIALSNRGVLRALTGDSTANEDFAAALALDAGVRAPAKNLARLHATADGSVGLLQADF